MIFIDEYQDCDYDMHLFFMKLKNDLNIKLFIVGDSKQAIYLWRGAMSNIFDLLSKEDFNCYELVTNFRCDKEIENYANLFHNLQNFRMPSSEFLGNVILKKYDALSNSFAARNFEGFLNEFKKIIEDGTININKEITIIANVNSHAIKITELLNEAGYNFVFIPRTPIDEGLPNGYLLKELALYTKNKTYTTYDFLENTYIDERKQTRIEVDNIIRKLKKEENIIPQSIMKIVKQLGNYLGISIGEHEIEKFCESICDSSYDMAFRLTEEKFKVMTVFASKGLEFDQVLSFARYYAIYIDENLQNHYVCVTRAKEKFLMFVDNDNYFNHLVEVANAIGVEDITKLIRYDERLLTKIN
jgi:superfamily I DNA/RNA helicase